MTSKPAIRKALDLAREKRYDHVIRAGAEKEYTELKDTTVLMKKNNKGQVRISRVNAETLLYDFLNEHVNMTSHDLFFSFWNFKLEQRELQEEHSNRIR